jgi:anti-anti-sigma factor
MASKIRPPDGGTDRPEPSELFGVRLERDGDTATVMARGEIDLYTAPLLSSALREAMDGSVELIIVDLTDVSFMASSGLAALLAGLERARRLRCELLLAGGGRAVQRPLQAAGLDHHFEQFPSAAEAKRHGARRILGGDQGQDGSVAGHIVSSRSSQPTG